MKHTVWVLLCCLLLCGCDQEVPTETTEAIVSTTAIPTTSEEGLYDPGSTLEELHHGSVKVYPLNCALAYGMYALGDHILILSGEDTTTLTLLTGENRYPERERPLDFFLDARESSLTVHGDTLSYFDTVNRETVVLDAQLQATISGFDHTLGAIETIGDDKNSQDLKNVQNFQHGYIE